MKIQSLITDKAVLNQLNTLLAGHDWHSFESLSLLAHAVGQDRPDVMLVHVGESGFESDMPTTLRRELSLGEMPVIALCEGTPPASARYIKWANLTTLPEVLTKLK